MQVQTEFHGGKNMSKKMRFLISTVMATVLLLLVLAGIAFAKEPEASSTSAAHSTTWATSAVTPTISYMPATITDLGTYPFTYTIRLHNPISSPLTTTVRVTVTLDPYLDFDPESGTLLLRFVFGIHDSSPTVFARTRRMDGLDWRSISGQLSQQASSLRNPAYTTVAINGAIRSPSRTSSSSSIWSRLRNRGSFSGILGRGTREIGFSET